MKRRAPRTLLELVVARQGLRKGASTMGFIVAWSVASKAEGGPITLEQYAAYWKDSRPTAFRHQARFRECFPDELTPQAIIDRLAAAGARPQTEIELGYVPLALIAA